MKEKTRNILSWIGWFVIQLFFVVCALAAASALGGCASQSAKGVTCFSSYEEAVSGSTLRQTYYKTEEGFVVISEHQGEKAVFEFKVYEVYSTGDEETQQPNNPDK